MAEALNFPTLRKLLKEGKYAPIYLIHGDQAYYADELTKQFENILPEEERDFNQYIMYAPQVDAATVVDACQRYPMMAERQVVILKEAQAVDARYLNSLAAYAANPSPTTIFAIICRGSEVRAAELIKAIKASKGVVFQSKKLYDRDIPPLIETLVTEKGLHIEQKALNMLLDYVGTDVARVYNEIDKLASILGPGAMITPEAIERNIGVSKDFNNEELVAALARRNTAKAYRIVDYFGRNQKMAYPLTASFLYNYFSKLLVAAYSKDKSERGLLDQLGLKWGVQLSDIRPGLQNYNAWQMIDIIHAIREFDAQSKGIGSRANPNELLTQLVFRILNTTGR